MNFHIYRVILPVNNIEEAQKFYSELLGIEGSRVSPGRHYFNLNGVILACFDAAADGDDIPFTPNPDHIYISTSDLENIFLKAESLKYKKLTIKLKRCPGEKDVFI